MHHYRQALLRMRQGDSDRDIAKSGLMGRRTAASLRTLAGERDWLATEQPAGGLGLETERPPYWSVTFEVDGTDAAVARVLENGGGVILEPFDFEYGRLAVVTGPDGEPFGMITSAPMPV